MLGRCTRRPRAPCLTAPRVRLAPQGGTRLMSLTTLSWATRACSRSVRRHCASASITGARRGCVTPTGDVWLRIHRWGLASCHAKRAASG
eukprot:5329002-Prymnesium_polylepis.2